MTLLILPLLPSCMTYPLTTSLQGGNTTDISDQMESLRQDLAIMTDRTFGLENRLLTGTGDVDLTEQLSSLRRKMEDMPGELYDLQLRLTGEQEGPAGGTDTRCGSWSLGMNLNPADGHVMHYLEGWAVGAGIGSEDVALSMDYLNRWVWREPADYIAIVRHQHGVVDAVKVFRFKYWGISLLERFRDVSPGRWIVTEGGPLQEEVAGGAANLHDDPIFSVGGDLAFNWCNGNNGHRIVMTGGFLAPRWTTINVDDDNTHGLGNHFACNCEAGNDGYPQWEHEISNIQDCPNALCLNQVQQGTDHGSGPTLKSGPVYGNYAIYVSRDADSFPPPGFQLDLNVEEC